MILLSYDLIPATSQTVNPNAALVAGDFTFKDLALDPATGDLAIRTNAKGGRELFFVTGAAAIVQRLAIRFHFFLGEWFLDQRQGVPYIQSIFVKAPDLKLVTALLRRVVEQCPGVARVENFSVSFDKAQRTLTIDRFTAVLVSGATLVAQSQPFLVNSR